MTNSDKKKKQQKEIKGRPQDPQYTTSTVLHQSSPLRDTELLPNPHLPASFDVHSSSQSPQSASSRTRRRLQLSKQISVGSISSTTSDHHSNTAVYVQDAAYVWLPAYLVPSKSPIQENEEQVNVTIVLPDDWTETTMLESTSTISSLENATSTTGFGAYQSPPTQETIPKNKTKIVYKYELDAQHSKIPTGVHRSLELKDYINHELPLQNVDRHALRRSSIQSKNIIVQPIVNARDMADLHYLHEAAILYNLKQRHGQSLPYTRVGDIVVAVNPFEWIEGLYSMEKQNVYAKHLIWENPDLVQRENDVDVIIEEELSSIGNVSDEDKDSFGDYPIAPLHTPSGKVLKFKQQHEEDDDRPHDPMTQGSMYSKLGLEPHVYETASLAYRGLASDRLNQTVLVSGESGAGKTETVKIVMRNLATVEQTRPFYHPKGSSVFQHPKENDVVKKVLESNPLFEAFGCAKTVRNDNSSRFGRFTQMQYQVESRKEAETNDRPHLPLCLLRGSFCATYLLEKSRVVAHADGERSYHIFYQMLAAPDSEKNAIWEELSGSYCNDFKYIGETKVHSIEGMSDAESWKVTVQALNDFGFTGEPFRELFRALCIVLQLGELTFVDCGSTDEGSKISSTIELDKLSRLMGISSDTVVEAMTTRTNRLPGGRTMTSKPNPKEAKEGCDALAKSIYASIFDTLVQQMNDRTSVKAELESHAHSDIGTISLLDIFGFERFEVNRFEQLCINYANEKLQYRYVLDNFRAVKKEYTAEGIEIFDFSIVDNSPVLELLEGKASTDRFRPSKLGIFTSLNEECQKPQGKASSFVYKLKHQSISKQLLTDKLHRPCEFGVKHFAGPVTYDASEFLSSNTDLTPTDLIALAAKTSNSYIRNNFAAKMEESDGNKRGSKSKKTVLSKFQSQLNLLMKCIEETKTRYIRCIKPNSTHTARKLNHRETMNQLESAGLVTAITISRETFPNRLPYELIWERFRCLYDASETNKNDDIHVKVEEMLTSLLTIPFIRADGARVPSFACGKTKVFFRAGSLEHLESDRMQFVSLHATTIQTWYRSVSSKKKFLKLKQSIIRMQSVARGRKDRKAYQSKRIASVLIQAKGRMMIQRRHYLRLRVSVVEVQSLCRMLAARKFYSLSLLSVIRIQNRIRTFQCRRTLRKKISASLKIQSYWRGSKARAYAIELMKQQSKEARSVTKIKSIWRMYKAKVRVKRIIKSREEALQSILQSGDTPNTEGKEEGTLDLNVPVLMSATMIHRLKKEISLLRQKNRKLGDEKLEYQSAFQESTDDKDKLIADLQRKVSTLEKENREMDSELESSYNKINSLESRINSLKNETSEMNIELEKSNGEVNTLRETTEAKDKELINTKSRLQTVEGEVESLKTQIMTLLKEMESRDEDLQKALKHGKNFEAELETVKNNARLLEAELNDELRASQRTIDFQKEKMAASEEMKQTYKRQIEGSEAHITELEADLEKRDIEIVKNEKEIQELKVVCQDLTSNITQQDVEHAQQTKKISSMSESMKAIEKKLSESSSNESSLKERILVLEEQLMDQQTQHQEKVAQMTKTTTELEKELEDLSNVNKSLQESAKDFEEEIKEKNDILLGKAKDIKELEKTCETFQASMVDIEQKSREREEILTSLTSDFENVKSKLEEANDSVQRLSRALQEAEEKNGLLLDEMTTKESTLRSKVESCEELQAEKSHLQHNLDLVFTERNSLQNSVNILQHDLDCAKAEVKLAEDARDLVENISTEIKEELAQARERIEFLEKENAQLQLDMEPVGHEIPSFVQDELKEQYEKTQNLEDHLAKLLEENTSLTNDLAELEASKSELMNHMQSVMTASKSATNRSKALLETNKSLLADLNEVKLENARMHSELAAMASKNAEQAFPLKAKYEHMIYDLQANIMELKEELADALKGREMFAQNVEAKMQQEREVLLSEIHDLRSKIRNNQGCDNDYKGKLLSALQSSHSQREVEIRKLKKEVKRLKSELLLPMPLSNQNMAAHLAHRNKIEQARSFIQVHQSERQKKLIHILSQIKSVVLQKSSASRDTLVQKAITSIEELCRSEELEKTEIMSLFTLDEDDVAEI